MENHIPGPKGFSGRNQAIDMLRAVTVLIMIFVNSFWCAVFKQQPEMASLGLSRPGSMPACCRIYCTSFLHRIKNRRHTALGIVRFRNRDCSLRNLFLVVRAKTDGMVLSHKTGRDSHTDGIYSSICPLRHRQSLGHQSRFLQG